MADAHIFWLLDSCDVLFVSQYRIARRLHRNFEDCLTIRHQILKRCACSIPLEHCEFRAVERPGLAISKGMCEREDLALASGDQLFHRKFRRGVEVEGFGVATVGVATIGAKCVEMEFIAG